MNEILLYDEIGGLGTTAKDFKAKMDEFKDQDFTIRVNSEGGDVFDGCTIFNLIKGYKGRVTAHIDGLCASIASVIVMAADECIMADNALMMIHDPWSLAMGTADDFRSKADLLDKVKSTLITSYESRTAMTRDEISAMMTAETWVDADEAIEAGLVSAKEEPILVAAKIRDSKKSKLALPERFKNKYTEAKQKPTPGNDIDNIAIKDTNSGDDSDLSGNKNATDLGDQKMDEKQLEIAAKQAAKDALAADRTRREGIANAFTSFTSHGKLMAECQDNQECSISEASALLLVALGKGETPTAQKIESSVDSSDKFREGASQALSARAGFAKMDATNEFRGLTLGELAKASLERAGSNTAGMDKMTVIANAFTHSTSDFGYILSSTASKSMLKGWDEATESFEQFTSKGSLPDFKVANRVDLNNFPTLREVRAGAEYKHVTIGDRGESLQLVTFGELFSINRQTIINDDLSLFTRIPLKFGQAAKRTVGDLVWAQITGNVVMSDGVALFNAAHKNLGTAGVITTASVDELRKLMALQKDPAGNATLNIRPTYMLVPVALEGLAKQVMESETEMAANQANSKRPNYVKGLATVISDARLDNASATSWYIAANQAVYDGIEVAYLDGMDSPFLDQMQGWNIDGSEFKVRIDAGVKALDFRTFAKNAGA